MILFFILHITRIKKNLTYLDYLYIIFQCVKTKTRLVRLKNILPGTNNKKHFYKFFNKLNYGNDKQKECAKRIK